MRSSIEAWGLAHGSCPTHPSSHTRWRLAHGHWLADLEAASLPKHLELHVEENTLAGQRTLAVLVALVLEEEERTLGCWAEESVVLAWLQRTYSFAL